MKLLALLLLLLASTAQAIPLTGAFDIIGNFSPFPISGNIGNITQIDFTNCNLAASNGCTSITVSVPTPGVPGQFLVTNATGGFAPLAGQYGSIKDFTFAGPAVPGFPVVPIAFFETVGGLSFDLNTVSVIEQAIHCVSQGGASCLILSGTGTF